MTTKPSNLSAHYLDKPLTAAQAEHLVKLITSLEGHYENSHGDQASPGFTKAFDAIESLRQIAMGNHSVEAKLLKHDAESRPRPPYIV